MSLQRSHIARRTPLRRASDFSGPWPSRSKPIKVKRSRPRRRNRNDQEHGMPWKDVRLVIYVRSQGRCEGCGKPMNVANMEGHHRLTRQLGPDCPCNALALCGDCHHGPEGHGGPERARELGRIIRREDPTPPTEIPVDLWSVGTVLLTCGGDLGAVSA